MAHSSIYARMGRLSAIIMILPGAMAAGGFLGYFVVDRYLGIFPWGTLVLLLLGAGAGFYEIYRILTVEQSEPPRNRRP